MIDLTPNARAAAQKISTTPTIVFKINGYDKIFTSAGINEYIRIGDEGLEIGDDWVIGGVRLIKNQSTYMSFGSGGGSTTRISQKLQPDRAQGTSISNMTISLIDKNEEISRLISPGFELEEIIGRDCVVSVGFLETSYPEDYDVIFRGIISDVDAGAGYVNLLLSSADEKRRRPLFDNDTTDLNGAITNGPLTSLSLLDASTFPQVVNGPDGQPDPAIEFLAQIDDEIFKYETVSGNDLQNVTRAYLNTVADSHDDQAEVSKGVRLQGNGIDLALKLMLSGWNDYFVNAVPATYFNNIGVGQPQQNAIFFEGIDVIEEYGITPGDWITSASAIFPENVFTMRQIVEVDKTNDGSFVIVDGAQLVDEFNSQALISFRSKYDSLGIGLKMTPAEVDVARHEFIRDTFLSTFTFDFTEFNIEVTKDFIERELFLPMAVFSVPRSGRTSATYTIGPIASNFIQTLDVSNVQNAKDLKVRRSIVSNFFNKIEFKYDHEYLEDKYRRVRSFVSEESQLRIPTGDKKMSIASRGMRTDLAATLLSNLSSERLLARYRFGAEFIQGVKLIYGIGYPIEISDIVLVDYASLKLTDASTGNRQGIKKYMEVINKTIDNKTGETSFDLLNTAFEFNDRYGVISPSSKIDADSGVDRLRLKKSWGTKSFQNEVKKWEDYVGFPIIVHSPDWSFVEESEIVALGTFPDSMLIDPPLSVAPSEDWIVDVPLYPTDTNPNTNASLKAQHAFFSPNVPVLFATSQIRFEVAAADFPKFRVGAVVRLNNFDYTDYSPEAEVIAVFPGTNEIEIDTPTGFTINNTHEVKLIGFADGGYSYRYI
jgi:hypothetical protein